MRAEEGGEETSVIQIFDLSHGLLNGFVSGPRLSPSLYSLTPPTLAL